MMTLDAFKTSNANFNDSVSNIINASRSINEARDQERRALLERARFATAIGDKNLRNEALTQLRNGHGVAGFLKNIFGDEKGANPVENTVGIDMSQDEGGSVDFTPTVLKEKKAMYNGVDAEQGELLSALKKNFTDKKGRLDKAGWEQQLKLMGITNSPAPVANEYKKANKIVDEKIGAYKDLQQIQKSEDRKIDAENKKIDAENRKQQRIAEAKAIAEYRKNPDAYYSDVMKRSGLYVTKFTGDQSSMKAQNQRMYEALINAAVEKGDYKKAEQFNREYKANLASIDKNWGDDRGGKYEDLFDIRNYVGKSKSEKIVQKVMLFRNPDTGRYEQRVVNMPLRLFADLRSPEAKRYYRQNNIMEKYYEGKDTDFTVADWGQAGGTSTYNSMIEAEKYAELERQGMPKESDGAIVVGNIRYYPKVMEASAQ